MTAGPVNRSAFFGAVARQVGYTKANGSGCGSESWARWALVPVDASGRPALHWRDGKARHVGPRVSGKVCPQWLKRAEAFVRRVGPLRLHELADVAEWYRSNRVGEHPGDFEVPF